MEDAYPIAWVLAFPLSNERNAAVANQSLLHTMKCTDIEAQENNVSLCLSHGMISWYVITTLIKAVARRSHRKERGLMLQ